MNTDDLTLFSAFEWFLADRDAEGVSDYTLRNYRNTVAKCRLYFEGNPPLADVSRADWIGFLTWLKNDYTPDLAGGVAPRPEQERLSAKTIANIHTNLSAFYTWATAPGVDLLTDHLIRTIPRPRFENPLIDPLTRDEVKSILSACTESAAWSTRPEITSAIPSRDRNRAIVLTLLSTGVRASELITIRFGDVSLKERSIRVAGKGRGRDSKERLVYFGKSTGRAIWRYLSPRLEGIRTTDALFTSLQGDHALSRSALSKLLSRLGDRAGTKCNPHRFRHTFATEFLRNGGDVLKLQALLGHSSLEMVKRYAHFVDADCAAAHEQHDPVDSWRL